LAEVELLLDEEFEDALVFDAAVALTVAFTVELA
jgi:hypothetical protein